MSNSVAQEYWPARLPAPKPRDPRREPQLSDEQRALLAKLAEADVPRRVRGRLPADLDLRVRAIAQRAARRAAQSFVPADGMPIPWQDFYTFIWWKLATKVRSAHPPTKLLRELAYKRARDFWRESENAPLGLGEFGQRIQERQDDQDRVQVRRVLFDAHTDTRPLPGRRTDQRQIWAADDVGSSDPLAARADLQQRLAAALGSLSLRVRQVAALGIYGYTMEEIATGVGVSLRTVQRDTVAADLALHRARPLPL